MSSDPSASAVAERDASLPQMYAAPQDAQAQRTGPSPLYRIVWRWHFYAGLIVAPILLTSAITGGIYVFNTELSSWLYEDLYYVPTQEQRLSYDEQMAIAAQNSVGLELEGMILVDDPARSSQFVAHVHAGGDENPDQQHRVLFLDPHTGAVLGEQILEETFFQVVLRIHRSLFVGVPGRIVVELATCWGLILILTGVYLWWPRKAGRVRGVWLPRLKGKAYAVLRDWHAVTGFYVAGFAAVILATGLFVSQVWGLGYALVMSQVNPSSATLFSPKDSPPAYPDAPKAPLDTLVATLLTHSNAGEKLFVLLAHEPQHAHTGFIIRDEDHNSFRVVAVDQYTGQTVSVTNPSDFPPMMRVMAIAVSLHMGQIFGLPTKIIAFVSCLVLVGLVVTAVCMWLQRKPEGTWGLPVKPRERPPTWVYGLIVLLGVVLPTVGVSLLLILGIGALLRRTRGSPQPVAG